jgi:hypothetical protein
VYLNWSDPETFWLNATNLALGAVVLICLFVVLTAIVRAFMKDAKERKHVSAELDRDMQRLATLGPKGYADSHAFDVPGLGLTMADGGEKLDPSDPKRNKS